jgi:hypothetical protein
MLPSSPNGVWFEVTDAAGAYVTGLTVANFDFYAVRLNGSILSAWTVNPSIIEHPNRPGRYCFPFTSSPASPCWRFDVVPKNVAHSVFPEYWTNEQNYVDIDKMYSASLKPFVIDSVSRLVGAVVDREKGCYFYDEWDIPFVQDGVPIPLDGYTDLRLRVNTIDKTTRFLEAQNGVGGWVITGDVNGILHITWPESTGTDKQDIYAHIPKGATSAKPLKWQVDGLYGGAVGKRVPIVQSSDLTLFRTEELTP